MQHFSEECIVPDAGNFTFYTVRGGVEEQVEGGEVVRPGRSHIRVFINCSEV